MSFCSFLLSDREEWTWLPECLLLNGVHFCPHSLVFLEIQPNIRLPLPLEVEYQDTNTYRFVLNHSNSKPTQHLNIPHVYQMCSGCLSYSYSVRAVFQLVASVLVGVAAVAASVVLMYDIRSTRAEHISYRDPGLHPGWSERYSTNYFFIDYIDFIDLD